MRNADMQERDEKFVKQRCLSVILTLSMMLSMLPGTA